MWLFTPFGFFSIVQKPNDSQLTVRARVASDLDALRSTYLPELGAMVEHAGTDYPYRARVDREALARAAGEIVRGIDYTNFKSEVHKRQGAAREEAYHRVWDALYDLEKKAPAAAAFPPAPPGRDLAYGGVIVDDAGRVLLRKVQGGYGGYVWSFAKGGGERGEAPVAVALREVREELGCIAEVVAPIDGWFVGDTSCTRFWLMRPVADLVAFDPKETERVDWVSFEEAEQRLNRKRDKQVLAAARRLTRLR